MIPSGTAHPCHSDEAGAGTAKYTVAPPASSTAATRCCRSSRRTRSGLAFALPRYCGARGVAVLSAHSSPGGADRGRDWSSRAARMAGLVLAVAYAGTVVAANWASVHWSATVLGSLVIPAGTLWAGVTLTLRDLLYETAGSAGVAVGVTVGTGMSWLLASPQIAVASVVAFAVSETLDSVLYAVLRRGSRLRAVLGSNLLGLVVDSVVFVPLAFGSFAAVPGQLAGKTAATVLMVALLQIAWRHQGRAVPR